ncbi:MAG: diguanylate cyclase [Leptospiraceae bacterium]|nr:diguanylate cyclase [Leptospiraceae bacterium]MDW8305779.1 diguanylate cyclase [Leptospiraceae bacterium]
MVKRFRGFYLLADEEGISQTIQTMLTPLGESRIFEDLQSLWDAVRQEPADLVFLPLRREGWRELLLYVRRLRSLPHSHLFGVVLYCSFYDREIFRAAYRSGIEDIFPWPIDEAWFLAKIENSLYLLKKRVHTNALTGLPGIQVIEEQYYLRLALGHAFSVAYLDLDHFKPFNDEKGVKAGDRAIQYLSLIFHELRLQYSRDEVFVGHLGGDDFFILGRKREVREVIDSVYRHFPKFLPQLFSSYELARGYYRGVNREGVQQEFPLLSLSTAILNIAPKVSLSFEKISEMAALVKKKAKAFSGMSVVEFFVDRSE